VTLTDTRTTSTITMISSRKRVQFLTKKRKARGQNPCPAPKPPLAKSCTIGLLQCGTSAAIAVAGGSRGLQAISCAYVR